MLQKLQLKLMWRTIWSRLVFRILCECLQIACYKSVLVCVCLIINTDSMHSYSLQCQVDYICDKGKHKLPDAAGIIRLDL